MSICYVCWSFFSFFFFFFNDTATTEIYTLSLHDALPISDFPGHRSPRPQASTLADCARSEEHTSELQSQSNLVCRLLLEKKKKKTTQSQFLKKKKRNIQIKNKNKQI